MGRKNRAVSALLAAIALSVAGTASADWLAVDPGTPISLQVNTNGALVVRPLGGAWTHPVCPDVTAAELKANTINSYQLVREILIEAATSGSVVNIFAFADECDEHGHPIVRNIRVQGP
jgi:hypothetical protein